MLHVHEAGEASEAAKPVKAKPAAAKGEEVKDKPAAKPAKKRPASAPAAGRKKPPAPAQPEAPPPSVDLRSYSKSLRLLGLDIPSNRREATKVESLCQSLICFRL